MSISIESINFDNFICYFEGYYLGELGGLRSYEQRMQFLKQMKKIALEHRYIYELRHGKGAYILNLGKYGALQRTPCQIIEGDLNCTHLLMPKVAHNYATRFCFSKHINHTLPNNIIKGDEAA